MKQVTEKEFWAFIMGATFDIKSSIERGPYPYTSLFKAARDGRLVAKKVSRYETPGRTYPVISDYFLESK
jgi:hypothetical protein